MLWKHVKYKLHIMRFTIKKPKLSAVGSVAPTISGLATTSLNALNPKFLSDVLFKKNKRTELFLLLSLQKKVLLLRTLTPNVRRELLQHLSDQELIPLLHFVDPDAATDMLQLLPAKRREKILQLVSEDLKNALSTLLAFDAETAAGLMTLDYALVSSESTIVEVAKKFKIHENSTGRPPVILVTKEDNSLAGFLPGHELGFAGKNEKISKYVKRIPSISYAATHDEVIRLFRTHPHSKVVVKNDSGSVIGIIYSDDVLSLIQDQEASSLYDFAGIRQEESVADSTRRKVINRYRWLIVNVFTAFLAAFTVGQFETVIQQHVLLAAYMPIVAGMGGNASMQTFAVLVRGISLGQISLRTAGRTLRNEMGAGFINGLIIAFIVAAFALLKNDDPKIGAVLALAMVINLLVAAFFGTLVPLIMSRLGKDPASSASIFITTATDVLGFLSFLGLATFILR